MVAGQVAASERLGMSGVEAAASMPKPRLSARRSGRARPNFDPVVNTAWTQMYAHTPILHRSVCAPLCIAVYLRDGDNHCCPRFGTWLRAALVQSGGQSRGHRGEGAEQYLSPSPWPLTA